MLMFSVDLNFYYGGETFNADDSVLITTPKNKTNVQSTLYGTAL